MRNRGFVAVLGLVVLVLGCGDDGGGGDNGGEVVVPSPGAPASLDATVLVTRVIDGDTIEIENGDVVRLIGIDTPEVGQECLADEVTARTAAFVQGQTVFLDICEQEPRDNFGRLLAFVFVNGIHLNAALLNEGLATFFFISPCNASETEFQALEEQAKAAQRGIWGPACNVVTPPPPPPPPPPPAPPPPPPPSGCCKICSNSKPCGDSCISRSFTCHQPPGCACSG